jgi:PRTRC genetic system protein C
MSITAPTRIFKLGGMILQDIDPEMTPEQIITAYAVNYPSLQHATYAEPVLKENNELEYVIENTTAVKTKG